MDEYFIYHSVLFILWIFYLLVHWHLPPFPVCLFLPCLLTLSFEFFTINAFFCFSLPLPCVWCLSAFILPSFTSLSNLKLQSSCHKPNNRCCPLPAMKALPRILAVTGRVEPAQPSANNSLVNCWGSCLWIRNILKSF